jgi:hypothetical protein
MTNLINLQEWREEMAQNPDYERQLYLTEDEVRSCEEFKDASQEEIVNIIETLHDFALITYEAFYAEMLKKQQGRQAA